MSTSISATEIGLPDNAKLKLGTGEDLKIYHDGSHSRIVDSGTGDLKLQTNFLSIVNAGNTENMAKFIENGAVELYHDNTKVLETMTSGVRITDNFLEINDTSCHLDFMENGSSNNHRLRQNAGNLYIQKLSDDKNTSTTQILVDGGTGAVELYHNGTKKLETTSSGVEVFGQLQMDDANSHIKIPDNARIDIGNSNDLQIYHNANANTNEFTSPLSTNFRGKNLYFYVGANVSSEQAIMAYANQGVELYYDNTKKFETTAAGIDVSGAGIFHSIGVSNAVDIEQQTDGNYTGIRIRNFYTGSAKNMMAFLDNNGNVRGSIVINNTTTTYNTTSDYRIKENVINLTDGITRLKKLKPYKFNFVGDSSNTVDGFFAHEAATVVPEAVTGTKDAVVTQAMIDAGEYTSDKLNQEIHQGIDQSKLVPLLVAAVQELAAKVEALEAA